MCSWLRKRVGNSFAPTESVANFIFAGAEIYTHTHPAFTALLPHAEQNVFEW